MSKRPAAKMRVARISINRNGTASYDPRELWVANVSPLVAGAREAASQAARTARAQRARAYRQPPWWQRRWLVFTAAGLAVGGAAGAVYAMARRRSHAEAAGDEPAARTGRGTPDGMRSTVEAGREKVAGATRTMMHKIRHIGEATTAEQPAVGDQPRRNEMPATGSGYSAGQPR